MPMWQVGPLMWSDYTLTNTARSVFVFPLLKPENVLPQADSSTIWFQEIVCAKQEPQIQNKNVLHV